MKKEQLEQQATPRQLSHQQKWTSYERRRQPNHLFASNDSITILEKKMWQHKMPKLWFGVRAFLIDWDDDSRSRKTCPSDKQISIVLILQRICFKGFISILLKFCKPHVEYKSLLRNLTRIIVVNIWRAVTDLLTSKVTTPSVTETIWQLLLLRVSRNTNLSI